MQVSVPLVEGAAQVERILAEQEGVPAEDLPKLAAAVTQPVGVKKLLLVLEMAKGESGEVSYEDFAVALHRAAF